MWRVRYGVRGRVRRAMGPSRGGADPESVRVTTAEATGYAMKSGNIARWQRHRQNPIQRTPAALFRKLHAEFGFTLDAAASDVNALCPRYFTRDQDALGQDWGTDVVWLNPPFGK